MEDLEKKKKKFIFDQSMDILQFINLPIKNSNQADQLFMVMKIYKYVVQNIREGHPPILNEESKANYESFYLENLMAAVKNNPGTDITNSILLDYLLYMKGFDSYIVEMKSINGFPHVANLVKLGDEFYYFDATQERMIYTSGKKIMPEEFAFATAALGKDPYERLYSPVRVYPTYNSKVKVEQLENFWPSNISRESYYRKFIEEMSLEIPDMTLDPKGSKREVEGEYRVED